MDVYNKKNTPVVLICCNLQLLFYHMQYVPGLSLQEGKIFLFLILGKNFRGITFFASSETPISVIKKSFSTQRKT
jgi:hypothetical protein